MPAIFEEVKVGKIRRNRDGRFKEKHVSLAL